MGWLVAHSPELEILNSDEDGVGFAEASQLDSVRYVYLEPEQAHNHELIHMILSSVHFTTSPLCYSTCKC